MEPGHCSPGTVNDVRGGMKGAYISMAHVTVRKHGSLRPNPVFYFLPPGGRPEADVQDPRYKFAQRMGLAEIVASDQVHTACRMRDRKSPYNHYTANQLRQIDEAYSRLLTLYFEIISRAEDARTPSEFEEISKWAREQYNARPSIDDMQKLFRECLSASCQ